MPEKFFGFTGPTYGPQVLLAKDAPVPAVLEKAKPSVLAEYGPLVPPGYQPLPPPWLTSMLWGLPRWAWLSLAALGGFVWGRK